jgi:hypothetical protein
VDTKDDHSSTSENEEVEHGMSSEFDDREPSENEDQRDEVKEVHKLAQKETTRVRMGKLLVLVFILGTYIFLKKEEDDNGAFGRVHLTHLFF